MKKIIVCLMFSMMGTHAYANILADEIPDKIIASCSKNAVDDTATVNPDKRNNVMAGYMMGCYKAQLWYQCREINLDAKTGLVKNEKSASECFSNGLEYFKKKLLEKEKK